MDGGSFDYEALFLVWLNAGDVHHSAHAAGLRVERLLVGDEVFAVARVFNRRFPELVEVSDPRLPRTLASGRTGLRYRLLKYRKLRFWRVVKRSPLSLLLAGFFDQPRLLFFDSLLFSDAPFQAPFAEISLRNLRRFLEFFNESVL